MSVVLWLMALALLFGGGHSNSGCMKWFKRGEHVCCEACFPGNRLVTECGLRPKDLCTPCETGTYMVQRLAYSCEPCTQCVAAQVLVKECTATRDTQCGCKEGLMCGDGACSFCVEKCDKGHEPTKDRSCRPCPEGTFNDQTHQKCKPWRTKCPLPHHTIVTLGDAFSDIKCANITQSSVQRVNNADTTEGGGYLALAVGIGAVLFAFSSVIFVIIFVAMKKQRKGKKQQKPTTKTPIVRPTTDDPRTLIAIECSFHEAQQEEGGSSESVFSKDSSQQLVA